MLRKLLLPFVMLALMTVPQTQRATAQYLAPRMSVHLSNPLGLVNKFGGRLQYRLNNGHSFLAGYRKYWGFFPGYQATGTYQRYFRAWHRFEGFYYGKIGVGEAGYTPKPYFSGWESPYNSPEGYAFVGVGGGRRYNFGPFFAEINFGLKYTWLLDKVQDYNKNLFYSLGPGSFIDCSFHFGVQFFNEERQLFRKSLDARPRKRYRSKNKLRYY